MNNYTRYLICLAGIVKRELLRFVHQRERFLAALDTSVVMADCICRGLQGRAGPLHYPALPDVYKLRGVYRAWD